MITEKLEAYERLEYRLARWVGPYGCPGQQMVACSSGTAALHLALEALGIPAGSEVICPDFTMVACPRAIAMALLRPVFVGCRRNMLMDLEDVRQARCGQTSAIMAVHIYGRRCDMERLNDWVSTGIAVIEDMAEAHGIQPHLRTDAACWSFYKNKIVAGEEGGAVYFKDPRVASKARKLRSLGFTDAHDFTHIPGGHNYRLANCLAEKVMGSLDMFSSNLIARRNMESEYMRYLPKEWAMPERQVPWVFDIRIPSITYTEQDAIVKTLQGVGVPARHAFKPMHAQTEFRNSRVVGNVGEVLAASREVIYLPLTPHQMSPKDMISLIHQTLQGLHPSWVLPSLPS